MRKVPTLSTARDFLAFDHVLDLIQHGLITQLSVPNQSQDKTLKIRRVLSFVYACRIICRTSSGDNSAIIYLNEHLCIALDHQVHNTQINTYRVPEATFVPFNPRITPPKASPIYTYLQSDNITPTTVSDLDTIAQILTQLWEITLDSVPTSRITGIKVLLEQARQYLNNQTYEVERCISIFNAYLEMLGCTELISTLRKLHY